MMKGMMNELRTTTHAYNFLNRLKDLPTYERQVYDACLDEPQSLDEIANALNISIDEALSRVYALSNRGLVSSVISRGFRVAYASIASTEVRVALAKGYWV